eukprot:3140587-Rhodomonas_salina.1
MLSPRPASLLLLFTALPLVNSFSPNYSPSLAPTMKLGLAPAATASHHQPRVASPGARKEPLISPLFLRSKCGDAPGIALRSSASES